MITREIHLINDVKANILLNNDIIELKRIILNTFSNVVHIKSCVIIIFLNIKTSRNVVYTSIHARKIIIVLSRNETTMSIHYIIISIDRDFLFESNDLNLSLYAHLINVFIKNILVRNDDDKSIQIFRNNRFKKMTKLNFSSIFQMHVDEKNDVAKLIVRKSFVEHKINWFKKMNVVIYAIIAIIIDNVTSIAIFFLITTIVLNLLILKMFFTKVIFISTKIVVSKIILNNDIIIHRFNDIVVQIFKNFIKKYFDLWKNIDFAKVSKQHWMRISFKFDSKKRISKKIKIYSLNTKNRELIDVIFDKLHEVDKFN